jgi:aarF domain-containing kinase
MAAGTTYMYQTDEGFRRTLIFWYNAMPPFIEYKVTEAKMKLFKWDDETSTREFNILHEKWSPVTEELCLRMKGYYLKNAQLMSTQDHFVPKQYLKWMKKTQNEVPTVLKDGEWREIFEKSTGKKCSDVFEWWDDKPLGIASIGEVHRARLKGGKEVVIKIQAPGIERVFRNDMKQVKRFCELGLPQFVPALDEIEKQFMTEFDYVGEATNLDRICNNIMPVWGHKVAIPRPVMPLCTKDVLVMDFLSGKRLVDGIRDQYARYAKKMGMTLEELETKYRKDIKPVTIEEQRRQNNYQEQLIVVGDILFSLNWSRFLYNMSPLRWVAGPMKYEWTEKPINLGEIMQTLLDVHAWEILIDGAFNGDPHPGNILLMDDGRLGLIDYGQVRNMLPYGFYFQLYPHRYFVYLLTL